MRFIHTADWHIGGASFLPDTLERSEAILKSICDLASKNNISTIVVAGDLFDDADTTYKQRNLLENFLLEWDAKGFNFLIIPGNHDLLNSSGDSSIKYLSLLSDHNRFFQSVITETTKLHVVEDVGFLLLCHRPKYFKEDLDKAFQEVQQKGGFKKLVVVGHELIKGSVLDNNFVMSKGAEIPPIPVDYFALGDIHKYQQMSENAYYSGAPYQLKFGENPNKGVLIVDTDQSKVVPEFVELPSKKLVVVFSTKEEIPDDAYIKLVTSDIEEYSIELSDVVVKKELVKDVELSISFNKDGGLKENLVSGVRQKLKEEENLEELMSISEVEIENLLGEIG
jgi:DNA repair exonuclease SbcCD nuclease subunit